MLNLISRFARDEAGAAGVEYGILVAFIAAGMIAAVAIIGDYIQEAFRTVCTALSTNLTLASAGTCPAAPGA